MRLHLFQVGELKNPQACGLRGDPQHIRARALFFRRTKNPGDFITTRQKCIEYGTAKVLLADDGDFHGFVFSLGVAISKILKLGSGLAV